MMEPLAIPSLWDPVPSDLVALLAVGAVADNDTIEAIEVTTLVVVAELETEVDVYNYPVAGMEK